MAEDPQLLRPDYFVLEYSPSQKAWHIQHIEDLIQENLLAYMDQSGTRDYMLMGVAPTREELRQLLEEIEEAFRKIHPEAETDSEKDTIKPTLFQRIRKIFRS